MNEESLNKFKDLLEKELTTVEAELKSVGQVNPLNPKDWEPLPDKIDVVPADPNEVADNIESYEENSAILKQLEIRVNEVKDALQRIADKSYGKCSVCGELIDERRLMANPAATTCTKHM